MEKLNARILTAVIESRILLGLTDREVDVLEALIAHKTFVKAAASLGISANMARVHAKHIGIRVRQRMNEIRRISEIDPSRHAIDYGLLPTRVRGLFASMAIKPRCWEDVAYAQKELMSQRNAGEQTYQFVKEQIAIHCDPHYHLI